MTTFVACPACQQSLQLPPELLGQDVRCPGCANIFKATSSSTAVRPAAPATPPPVPGEDIPVVHDVVVENVPVWERRPEEDELARPLDEDEAREAERRRRREEKKARKTDTSQGGIYGDVMRRQRKMHTPHRGVLALVLGILSIVFSPCCLLAIGAAACGYYAYQIGSHDLQDMLSGRMDRSGEPLAKTGKILGIVGICLSTPVILASFIWLLLVFIRVLSGLITGH